MLARHHDQDMGDIDRVCPVLGASAEVLCCRFCTKTLNGHDDWVRNIIATADGKTLASCSNDQTIRIWSVDTGKETACLRGHSHVVESIAFAPEAAYPVIRVISCQLVESPPKSAPQS